MNRRDWAFFLTTSIGLIFIFPPLPTGFLAPFVLIPYFFLVEKHSPWMLAKIGYVAGLIWGMGTIYWIGWATVPGLLGALLVFALYFALYSFLQGWFYQVWGKTAFWFAPVLWFFVEWFSSLGPMAFPWNALAYSQASYPVLIQFASYVGTYGVGFWLVLLNVLIYKAVVNRHLKQRCIIPVFFAICLVLIPLVYGMTVVSHKEKPEMSMQVTLVQGNIDPYKKWTASFIDSNITIYETLTRQTVNNETGLVVWPETAVPGYLKYRYSYLKRIRALVDSLDTPLVVGAPDYRWIEKGQAEFYNSVFLVEPNRHHMQQYSKMHLVPFSERVPLVSEFPALYRLIKKMIMDIGDFTPGDSLTAMDIGNDPGKRFGTVICFDSVFPQHVRNLIAMESRFLVIITNDGWFGRTSGPYQHASMAVLRAIENGVDVVRCANTGVSCFVDRYGYVKQATPIYQRKVIQQPIDLYEKETFYVRYGHVWIWIMAISTGILSLVTGGKQIIGRRQS